MSPFGGFRVVMRTAWIVPSAAAVTASSPISAPVGTTICPPFSLRQRDQLGARQERAGAEHHHAACRPRASAGRSPRARPPAPPRRQDRRAPAARRGGRSGSRSPPPASTPPPCRGRAPRRRRAPGRAVLARAAGQAPARWRRGRRRRFVSRRACGFPVIPGLAEGESPEPITTTSYDDAKRSCAFGIAGVYGFRALRFAEPRNDREWSKPQPTHFPAPSRARERFERRAASRPAAVPAVTARCERRFRSRLSGRRG